MRQLVYVLGGLFAGLATGLVVWLIAGGGKHNFVRIQAIADQTPNRRISVSKGYPVASYVSVGDMVANPIFYSLTKAAQDRRAPSIAVQGISLTPARAAALVSIDGQPAHWLARNDEEGGVILTQVTPQKAVFDTEFGTIEVSLGAVSAQSAEARVAPISPVLTMSDQIPPGMRSPPPPASAPTNR